MTRGPGRASQAQPGLRPGPAEPGPAQGARAPGLCVLGVRPVTARDGHTDAGVSGALMAVGDGCQSPPTSASCAVLVSRAIPLPTWTFTFALALENRQLIFTDRQSISRLTASLPNLRFHTWAVASPLWNFHATLVPSGHQFRWRNKALGELGWGGHNCLASRQAAGSTCIKAQMEPCGSLYATDLFLQSCVNQFFKN